MTNGRTLNLTWIVLAGTVLLALPHARFARGQDDWDAEAPVAAGLAQPGRVVMEQNLYQWIFNSSGETQMRKKIDSMLTLRLDALERAGGLSEAQIEKLRLAGRGDVARLFRKVDALAQECKGLDMNDQKLQEMWPKINVLQVEFSAGLFDENSLFQKVLEGMSRTDPSAPYQEQERQRRQFCHRATIELAVTTFELGVPLTAAQRQKFLDLLVDELEPPRKFGNHDQHVVFYQAGKLDQEKLKPIFDDAQWRALNQMFRQAKGMEKQLKQEGYLP